jgi:hypothetical protein
VAGQTLLSSGSAALNTASQFSVLAANISNAGGYAKFLHGALDVLGAPFKALGGMVVKFITNLFGMGASSAVASAGTGAFGVASAGAAGGIGVATAATGTFAASMWAAAWPVLAVVGAIALVAGGAYLLIKNWDSIADFFVGLWGKITGIFSSAWNGIKNLFSFKEIVGESENAGTNINENLTQNAQVNPVVPPSLNDILNMETAGITTPILNTQSTTATMPAFNEQNTIAPMPDVGQLISAPIFGNNAATVQPVTVTDVGGAFVDTQPQALATTEQSPAFSGQLPAVLSPAKMNSPAMSYHASSAFESAISGTKTLMPGMEAAAIAPAMPRVDMDDFNKQASITFQAAMPAPERPAALENMRRTPERTASAPQSINIENLYVQAEDIQKSLDFVKIIMQSAHRPQAEAV